MSTGNPADSSAVVKRALTTIDQLQKKLAAVELAQREPIAIIGMSCRFPGGAENLDGLWNLLENGVDAVTEVPATRWDVSKIFDPNPDAVGKSYTKWGAFIDGVDQFDAAFFGITPREAMTLDPQQRLLLELSWLALEEAGVAPSAVANTRTGVYVGLSGLDYMQILKRDMVEENAFAVSGVSHSIAGGRISYFLGAQGPNISLDTACSSSMAAVHLGVKALRGRECDMVLAGGVNLQLTPEATIMTSRARMMSPTGRCHSFDAAADGYVRADGCAMIALKRLSDARRDGDQILALIRGSALNQDGRSSGLTAPNGPAQEAVIRAALADARAKPADIAFIEAHGTGTSLGDPIEVNALASVFRERPAERPLLIGSIKANIGHSEAAAGIAGLAKAIQALRHRTMPRQLHMNEPNPMIDWSWPVRVPRENAPLEPPQGLPLMCGVSSFGFSGTNAHIVLEEAPPAPQASVEPHPADASTLLVMSGRTGDAVEHLAKRYADLLAAPAASALRHVAANAPLARSHFMERLAVVASSSTEASAALAAFARGEKSPSVIRGRTLSGSAPEIVFLFTGQGAQYAEMGKRLYETEPAFATAFDACDRVARETLSRSLKEIVFDRGHGELDDTTYTQPALFALEYSLAETWRAWGVEPTAVMGHSVGEYTAACVAGMMTLEDAMRLIATRGKLMGRLPAGGGMAAVFATESVLRKALQASGEPLDIAAVNGPSNVVVSGPAAALDRLLERLQKDGIEFQRLKVSHAFHSSLMDPILDEFEEVVSRAELRAPRITVMSNVTGAPIGAEALKPAYWRRHLRDAVRFSDSVAGLQSEGYRVFLEVGPAPVLTGMAQRCSKNAESTFIPSLRRGRDDRLAMLEAAARLYTLGCALDWPAITGKRIVRTALPTYPFQRQRFWQEPQRKGAAASLAGTEMDHPLLGVRVSSPVEIYQTTTSEALHSWVKDHRIFGMSIFPGAGFLELALAAARANGDADAVLEDVAIGEALVVEAGATVSLQAVVHRNPDHNRVEIYSAAPDDGDEAPKWRRHLSGSIAKRGQPANAWQPFDAKGFSTLSPEEYYAKLAANGAAYGPAMRGIRGILRRKSTVIAEVACPPDVHAGGFLAHPAMLDACLQAVGVALQDESGSETNSNLYLPVEIKGYRVFRPGVTAVTVRVSVDANSDLDKVVEAEIAMFDTHGALVSEIVGMQFRRVRPEQIALLAGRKEPAYDWRFAIKWQGGTEQQQVANLAGQSWVVLADAGGIGADLAQRMRKAGATVAVVEKPAVVDAGLSEAVLAVAPLDRPLYGAVLLWPLDAAPYAGGDLASLESAHADLVSGTLYGLRAVIERSTRVLVATRATQPVQANSINVVQAPIWAMAGVAASEYPASGVRRIDLDPTLSPADAVALFREAASADREDRICYRNGQRLVARLTLDERTAEAADKPTQLTISSRGSIGNLVLAPMDQEAPAAGEVQVRVLATGLNFRDVLNVLGAYPGDPGPLGNECSGIVSAVGSGVTRFAVGDEVVAMTDRSFATFVNVSEDLVVSKPAALTYQEAATVPVTFLTSAYALHTLSRMKAGDRVLIHAVTGGVGMAATQIALRAGAIVYGTAGSPAKRALARKLGVHFVSDSRSLSFVDDVRRDTQGEGVDIVLNSLAGEFIPASLGLLRQGGHFVEIGKTDILSKETAAAARPDVNYHPLYLGDITLSNTPLMRSMLEDILGDVAGGKLHPLPQTAFPLWDSEAAFRYMGQGQHTGKIVITQPKPFLVRAEGAYIVTGGLTGLGLLTAGWLAEQGARGIVLIGRRKPGTEAAAAIARMEASGATVRVAQLDIGDAAGLSALIEELRTGMGSIRGVVHAAGVLDDGMMSELTAERFVGVMAPKVRGGWLLHELTKNDPLDFFVMYSSGASVLASPGQANYAAANGFLDGLAGYRHARGLPSLAIGWGSWAEVGMAAGVSADHHRRWAQMGLEMITPEAGMRMLGDLLASGASPQIAAVPFVRTRLPQSVGPFYQELVVASGGAAEAAAPESWLEELAATPIDGRGEIVEKRLSEQVRRVLALPASQPMDRHETLLNLGMDSLMAMDLRNRLQGVVGVRVVVADLLQGISIAELARKITAELPIGEASRDEVEAEAGWEAGRI